jgi:hypothetical protein
MPMSDKVECWITKDQIIETLLDILLPNIHNLWLIIKH